MKALVLSFALVLLQGCVGFGGGLSELEGPDLITPRVPPGTWQVTPAGSPVYVPLWLDLPAAAENKVKALKSLDEMMPEAESGLPPLTTAVPGVPAGMRVWIMDPGLFSTPNSKETGLAAGMTDLRRNIWLPWRRTPTDPRLLPAAGHEWGHVWYFREQGLTAGVCAGHGSCATENAARPNE